MSVEHAGADLDARAVRERTRSASVSVLVDEARCAYAHATAATSASTSKKKKRDPTAGVRKQSLTTSETGQASGFTTHEKDPADPSQKLDPIKQKPHCAFLMKDARRRDAKLTLADLRKHRGVSQVKLAKRAKISQSEVSRTELRDDCLVSTLERYIAALGGELVIHAKFDGQAFPVTL